MPVTPLPGPRPHTLGRFFLIASFVLAAACGRERDEAPAQAADDSAAGLDAIREGMTMERVVQLWGTPNVRVREEEGERWSYWFRDDRQRVVGKAYVWFDVRRRVSEVRTAPEQRADPERRPPPVTVTLGPSPGRNSQEVP